MQLDVLVPQGNCGTRRTITVLGGFLPSLLSGIGQALADPGAERQLEVESGGDRRRGPVRSRGEVGVSKESGAAWV
ncbi:hypothetical protein AL68_03228, partial [Mycobacterium tuberculosis TKK_03_0113]